MMFDDILAECIEALEQGATINECMSRYPAHAKALEPLLRLVVSLSQESQTRLSSQAFMRGRQMINATAQAQQAAATAQHRQPVYASAKHRVPPAPYINGFPQTRRPLSVKRARWSLGLPRLLRATLLLLLLMGTTTLFRQVVTSLPGTAFYPVKSTGVQIVGVLMEAAGEGIPWHAAQVGQRLQELAQVSDADVTTVQTLSRLVETHWAALLRASEGLSPTERAALLQEQLAHFRAVEATWTTVQGNASPPAVATVRKLITASEEALGRPKPLNHQTEVVATVTSTAMPTTSVTPAPTLLPTIPATPLLQASATPSTTLPILVPTATALEPPTIAATLDSVVTPALDLPSPTVPAFTPLPITPFPAITVQMPQQESTNDQGDDNRDDDDTDNPSVPETAIPTAVTGQVTEVAPLPQTVIATPVAEDETVTAEPEDATAIPSQTLSPTLPPVVTEVQSTPGTVNQTPQPTIAVENTPVAPTKTSPSTVATAGATPAPATGTPRPTSQATATKTPKTTATPAPATLEAPTSTPAPSATTQPTTPPTSPARDEALQTPGSVSITPVFLQPQTPRPTAPGGEATKVAQP